MTSPIVLNQDFIESQYRLWKSDPMPSPPTGGTSSRGSSWRSSGRRVSGRRGEAAANQARVQTLVHRFARSGTCSPASTRSRPARSSTPC